MTLQKHVSLNINIRGLSESPTLAINERVKQMQSRGEKVYNLDSANLHFLYPFLLWRL